MELHFLRKNNFLHIINQDTEMVIKIVGVKNDNVIVNCIP